MEATVDTWCEGCEHLSKSGPACCEYILATGRRRPCPAGRGCGERKRPEKWRPDKRLRWLEEEREAKAAAEARARKAREAALARKKAREAKGAPKTHSEMNRNWLLKRRRSPDRQAQALAIKDWREYLGLTQGELAKRLGIHLNTMARWERGEANADWDVLEKAGMLRDGEKGGPR